MNKKNVFTAIIFFIVGAVYCAFFHSIVREDYVTTKTSIEVGLFIGLFSALIYSTFLTLLGYYFDEKELQGKVNSEFILLNIAGFLSLWAEAEIVIGYKSILEDINLWMHCVNALFSVVVMYRVNCDAKVIRNNRSK